MLVDPKELITLTTAGRMRGVSAPAMRSLVLHGRLRSVEIDGTTYLFRSEVEAFTTGSRERVRKMTNDEVLADVECVAALLGHPPSSFEYQQHGKIHLSTLCRRFGGWPKVRAALDRKTKRKKKKGK